MKFLCFLLFALGASLAWAAPPTYVGSPTCVMCHAAQGQAWRDSHHAKAMQPADDQTVLGDFNDASFSDAGITTHFFKRDGKFFVNTQGHDGKPADYEILHTFGVYPLQQYLVAAPGGRLQAMTIAWDARPGREGGQRWYSLHPGEKIRAGDALHWSGRDYNWNFMCAACHSTGVRKNYDAKRDVYATQRSEDGVACEACHGPGSRHIEWTRGKIAGVKPGDKGLVHGVVPALQWQFHGADQKIASPLGDIAAARAGMEPCLGCHARRQEIVVDKSPVAPFLDNYLPSLLDRTLYHADGQIDGEVFEFGSFAQSRMHRAGVTCTNCHDAHSGKLRAEGNALCAQCHRSTSYDRVEHFRHPPGSIGAQCVNCHMPRNTYMGIHARRDHSLRIPRPDLTSQYGTPNACNQCHGDKTAQWSANAIAGWTGRQPDAASPPAAAFDAAWHNSPVADRLLAALAARSEAAPITRASALSQLSGPATAKARAAIETAARDSDALLRIGAARALPSLEPQDALRIGLALLADKLRAVRIEAARALAGAPRDAMTPAQWGSLTSALDELIGSEQANADRPESHVNLAQIYLRLGRDKEAEAELNRALRLDRNFVPAMVNLADLRRAQQREDEAEKWLKRARAAAPQAAEPVHALGLLEIRRGRRDRALPLLRRASELAPGDARYAYVYALAVQENGDPGQALRIVEQALLASPQDASLLRQRIALEKALGRDSAARAHETEYTGLVGEGSSEARGP